METLNTVCEPLVNFDAQSIAVFLLLMAGFLIFCAKVAWRFRSVPMPSHKAQDVKRAYVQAIHAWEKTK